LLFLHSFGKRQRLKLNKTFKISQKYFLPKKFSYFFLPNFYKSQMTKSYPQAVETLPESCYMDDTPDSRSTEERARAHDQQLIRLLSILQDAHSQILHKFSSHHTIVISLL
jgi:hypothetical protein